MRSLQNIVRFFMGLWFSIIIISYTGAVLNIHYKFAVIFLVIILTAVFYCFIFLMTKEFHLTDLVFWGLSATSCILYYWSLRRPVISYDTWQVYDMSRYIFDDFGYMRTIRQHIVNTHYEMAFPPVFPCLMAISNLFLDMGIMSSVFLNFIFLLLLICILKDTGDYTGQRMPFAIATITFICTSLFRKVFMGGLTQLFGFLLFTILIRLVLKQDFTRKDCFLCAFISGIGLMNRFDFLAVTGIISFMIPFRVNQSAKTAKRLIWLFLNMAIILCVCSPWIVYSLVHFGKIFITDNGRRLINVVDTRPSTYFSTAHPAVTLFDDSRAWAIAFKNRCMISIGSLRNLISNYYIFKHFTVIIVTICIIFLLSFFIKKRCHSIELLKIVLAKYSGIIIIACAVCGQELLFIFTGYKDSRYHILFLFMLNLSTLILFYIIIKYGFKNIKQEYGNSLKKTAVCSVLVLSSLLFIYDAYHILQKDKIFILGKKLSGADTVTDAVSLSKEESEIDYYLYQRKAECLLIYRNEKNINVARTCSLLRTTTIISPSNISVENADEFVRDFSIDYIYSSDMDFNTVLTDAVEVVPTSVENLYMVR